MYLQEALDQLNLMEDFNLGNIEINLSKDEADLFGKLKDELAKDKRQKIYSDNMTIDNNKLIINRDAILNGTPGKLAIGLKRQLIDEEAIKRFFGTKAQLLIDVNYQGRSNSFKDNIDDYRKTLSKIIGTKYNPEKETKQTENEEPIYKSVKTVQPEIQQEIEVTQEVKPEEKSDGITNHVTVNGNDYYTTAPQDDPDVGPNPNGNGYIVKCVLGKSFNKDKTNIEEYPRILVNDGENGSGWGSFPKDENNPIKRKVGQLYKVEKVTKIVTKNKAGYYKISGKIEEI